MYHDYHIRLDEKLWKRIVTEAKLRGYTIKKMFEELLERGLITIYMEEDNQNEKTYKNNWK